MTTPIVYLLMGHNDYSDTYCLAAFLSQESADKALAACWEHYAARPALLVNAVEATDAECKAWNDADEKWRKAHPFGAYPKDSYHITEKELMP